MLSLSAKGELKYDEALLTMEDVERSKDHILTMIAYVSALEREMGASGSGLDALIEAYEATLSKPVWPEKIKRNPVLLQQV